MAASDDVLSHLAVVLEQRKQADPGSSYVASLHAAGLNKILEKVGEESVETILAAKDAATGGDRGALVGETADLWFHSMIMLSHLEIHVDEVLKELSNRFGTSGLTEKANRS